MLRHSSIAALLPFLIVVQVRSQHADNGTLYFPPKLVVKASLDDARFSRMFNTPNGVWDDSLNVPASDHIRFTRKVSWKSHQLLPMVFFDQGSSIIPSRYVTYTGEAQVRNYTEESEAVKPKHQLYDEDHPKYYDLLNIIGSRMAGYDGYRIALEGGYSTEAGENPELALDRAEVIREYLSNVWRIDTTRIALLPSRQMCADESHAFDREEARRVMIHSPFLSLLRPIRFRSSTIESSMIFFDIAIDPRMPPSEIKNIELVLANGDDLLGRTGIPTHADSSVYRCVGAEMMQRNVDDLAGALTMQAFVTSQNGRIYESEQVSIPIEIIEEFVEEEQSHEGNPSPSIQPLLFFEAGDSCLTRLQESILEDRMVSIAAALRTQPAPEPDIEVTAYSVRSELPGCSIADLIATREQLLSTTETFVNAMADKSFQNSLFLLPPPIEVKEGDEWTPRITSEMLNAWYGENADMAVDMMITSSQHGNINSWPDSGSSLTVARRNSTFRSMRQQLGNVVLDTLSDYYAFRTVSNAFTPESRFYNRSASFTVTLVDPDGESRNDSSPSIDDVNVAPGDER